MAVERLSPGRDAISTRSRSGFAPGSERRNVPTDPRNSPSTDPGTAALPVLSGGSGSPTPTTRAGQERTGRDRSGRATAHSPGGQVGGRRAGDQPWRDTAAVTALRAPRDEPSRARR